MELSFHESHTCKLWYKSYDHNQDAYVVAKASHSNSFFNLRKRPKAPFNSLKTILKWPSNINYLSRVASFCFSSEGRDILLLLNINDRC